MGSRKQFDKEVVKALPEVTKNARCVKLGR